MMFQHDCAPAGCTAEALGVSKTLDTTNPTGERAAYQGIRAPAERENGRQSGGVQFTVWVPKSNGTRVPFLRYPTRAEAVLVAEALQRVGLAASVEDVDAPLPEAP